MKNVVKYGIVTEKASLLIDKENSLQFAVDIRATKKEIKRDIEDTFEVKVRSIRTLITPDGEKRAIVTLEEGYSAEEVLTRLGVF